MFTISLALSFELSPSLASSIFSMALLIGPADPNGLRFSSLNFPNTMKFNIRKVVARVTPNAKTASPTFLIILLEYIFLLIDTRYLCNIQYMPKKVLFIEDDDSFFYTFSIPLNAKGYNVVRVSEGFQAVEKVLVEKPDLIFLDVSKMKAGKFEIHMVRGNLIELIKEVTSYIDPLIQVKGIHLTLDVKSDYNELAFDAERLRQVLNNLLSNAIKFTPKDGEITIRVIQIANGIEIRVSDTGIGIPDMDKETLFHKFMQGHNNGNSDKDKGTGLGLVIAKGIIEAHGGKIWIEDNKPKGACFIFDLPINSFGGEVAL